MSNSVTDALPHQSSTSSTTSLLRLVQLSNWKQAVLGAYRRQPSEKTFSSTGIIHSRKSVSFFRGCFDTHPGNSDGTEKLLGDSSHDDASEYGAEHVSKYSSRPVTRFRSAPCSPCTDFSERRTNIYSSGQKYTKQGDNSLSSSNTKRNSTLGSTVSVKETTPRSQLSLNRTHHSPKRPSIQSTPSKRRCFSAQHYSSVSKNRLLKGTSYHSPLLESGVWNQLLISSDEEQISADDPVIEEEEVLTIICQTESQIVSECDVVNDARETQHSSAEVAQFTVVVEDKQNHSSNDVCNEITSSENQDIINGTDHPLAQVSPSQQELNQFSASTPPQGNKTVLREVVLKRHQGQRFGMKMERRQEGIYLATIVPESQAAKAGLRVGDEIVSINGYRVKHLHVETVSAIIRASQKTIYITIRPSCPIFRMKQVFVEKENGRLGIRLFRKEFGLFLEVVLPNSPAYRSGLREGDELLQINDCPIDSHWTQETATDFIKHIDESGPVCLILREYVTSTSFQSNTSPSFLTSINNEQFSSRNSSTSPHSPSKEKPPSSPISIVEPSSQFDSHISQTCPFSQSAPNSPCVFSIRNQALWETTGHQISSTSSSWLTHSHGTNIS